MSRRLAARVALVTGAGSGIGEAICVRFAQEGSEVVVTSRSPEHVDRCVERVAAVTEHRPLGLELDVAERASVEAAVAATIDRFGRIDVLCANAGVELPEAPAIWDVPDEDWDRVMAVNVTGMFLVTRACVPHIPAGGSVVTIGSINSIVAWPNDLPYTTSKGAVLQFTRALALDLAPRRIRANCVCPGIIDTPLTRAFIDAAPDPTGVTREYEEAAPLGRMGTAEEVANAALFLASDEASFITGSALIVDGGTTAVA
jgi:NAD(P)-dependent dehydrogenase (short-subunit alcohol dehydrogenase family)